jgi:hypothetical protein
MDRPTRNGALAVSRAWARDPETMKRTASALRKQIQGGIPPLPAVLSLPCGPGCPGGGVSRGAGSPGPLPRRRPGRHRADGRPE